MGNMDVQQQPSPVAMLDHRPAKEGSGLRVPSQNNNNSNTAAPGLVRRASKAAQHYFKERRRSQQFNHTLTAAGEPEASQDMVDAVAAGAPTNDENSALSEELVQFLRTGSEMLKVTAKKTSKRTVRLTKSGQLAWQSYSLRRALLGRAASKVTSGDGHDPDDVQDEAGHIWTKVNLEHILELRFGSDAANYREQFRLSHEHESKWITVIFTSANANGERNINIVHFVVLGPQRTADAWKRALTQLVRAKRQIIEDCLASDYADSSQRWQSWINQCWKAADSNQDDRVTFDEVIQLCKDLGIEPNLQDLRRDFDAADHGHSGWLDMPSFQAFVKRIRRRPEIEHLLRTIAGDDNGQASTLNLDQFQSFLTETQKSSLSEQEIARLFYRYASVGKDGSKSMRPDDLGDFLRSQDNPASDPKHRTVWQDMTRPLCEYFISTSHNTYLIGNQLQGNSTAEGYIRVLQRGCRCVELDVWNGPDGEPVIYHGHTLTSKLPVREALQAIAKYAFVASPYPVTLSLEVHCDTSQQDKLAELISHYCGPALVTGPLDDLEPGVLPSPEQLQNRFLVKSKNLMISQKAKELAAGLDSQSSGLILDESSASEMSSASTTTTTDASSDLELTKRISRVLGRSPSSPQSPPKLDSPFTPTNSQKPKKSKEKPRMSETLASLLIYTIGVKSRGINKKEVYHPFHVLSISEKRLGQMIKQGASDLLDHTRSHVIRAYPYGLRLTSSNYNPTDAWAMGAQLVALNWQTKDACSDMNMAMFEQNGGCGFVLKPDLLRRKDPFSKDKEVLAAPMRFELKVTLISAQHLTRARQSADSASSEAFSGPSMSPYAEVEVFSPFVDKDKAPRKRTAATPSNAFNPTFKDNEATLKFEVLGGMLEVVFIRFAVYEEDHDDEALGHYCVPASALLPGYRHLPLCDALGNQFLFSTLFVYTHINPL